MSKLDWQPSQAGEPGALLLPLGRFALQADCRQFISPHGRRLSSRGDIASSGDSDHHQAHLRRQRSPPKRYFQKDRDTIEKRSGRWVKMLARQSQTAGFDLNARIPAWETGSSGRQIPGRN